MQALSLPRERRGGCRSCLPECQAGSAAPPSRDCPPLSPRRYGNIQTSGGAFRVTSTATGASVDLAQTVVTGDVTGAIAGTRSTVTIALADANGVLVQPNISSSDVEIRITDNIGVEPFRDSYEVQLDPINNQFKASYNSTQAGEFTLTVLISETPGGNRAQVATFTLTVRPGPYDPAQSEVTLRNGDNPVSAQDELPPETSLTLKLTLRDGQNNFITSVPSERFYAGVTGPAGETQQLMTLGRDSASVFYTFTTQFVRAVRPPRCSAPREGRPRLRHSKRASGDGRGARAPRLAVFGHARQGSGPFAGATRRCFARTRPREGGGGAAVRAPSERLSWSHVRRRLRHCDPAARIRVRASDPLPAQQQHSPAPAALRRAPTASSSMRSRSGRPREQTSPPTTGMLSKSPWLPPLRG